MPCTAGTLPTLDQPINQQQIKIIRTKEFSGKGERRRRRRKVLRVGTQPWPDDYFILIVQRTILYTMNPASMVT
jgi:hypothetical protein